MEKVRTRRLQKKKAKKLKNKIAESIRKAIKEINEVSGAKETKSTLKLVDRPLCNYFKSYRYKQVPDLAQDTNGIVTN